MRLTRALSSWDMKHNLVATYTYALPFDQFFGRGRLTDGWSWSGTTRFSTGFPVTLFDDSDRSLLGTLGNGVNNELLDTPEYLGTSLDIDTNPVRENRNSTPMPFSPSCSDSRATRIEDPSTARESKTSICSSANRFC
jgi:hypothetical protein